MIFATDLEHHSGEEFNIPVALCLYNRPDFVRKLIAALRAVCPGHILIVADGPNSDRPTDALRCQQARTAIDEIDWPCEIEWNVAETNLGNRKRI